MSGMDHVMTRLRREMEKGPVVMGVVNVTPDSFSDGGDFYNKNKAIEHGRKIVSQGAQILDIGGESTRPGAETVSLQEELDRVIPVIEGLADCGAMISIDTRNAKTMREALNAGAHIINDISALEYDSSSVDVVKQANCPVMIMHMQGSPSTMQENPNYNNVLEDVVLYLRARINILETAGVDKNAIIIDPGIGFGKTLEHNLILQRNIKTFCELGVPVLLGTSRKSFIGHIDNDAPAHLRLGGSISSVLWGISQGVHIVRVHDVAETVQAIKVWRAIESVR